MVIRVAGCALNQIPLDWKGNRERIVTAIRRAREQGASVICLPELCITGYGCEDAFFSEGLLNRSFDVLMSLLGETHGAFVSVGLPVRHKGALFNCTAVLIDGELKGLVPKKTLAGDGVYYEPRWFKAWPHRVESVFSHGATTTRFGDLHFEVGGIKIGFEICEEAWVPERPGIELAHRAVDLILNPSASHFAFGKLDVRKRFVAEGSRSFHCGYVYANLLGNEAGRLIYDGGTIIADGGEVVALGPRFSFRDVEVTSAPILISRNRALRQRAASYEPYLSDEGSRCVFADLRVEAAAAGSPPGLPASWEMSPRIKEEEFTRAVSLALWDFLRKSRQRGYVVSLSGGIDSSAVTALCRTALELAVADLGIEGVLARHPWVPAGTSGISGLAGAFISCAYQSTRNSSQATRDAARAVADDCGATFYEWAVDELVSSYVGVAESALGFPLSWETHDLALQNIQARVRGPSVWLIANIKGALLLATSNRSEAAVGYATMDGDTCGGLSPLGGIDKAFLRRWAEWMRDTGPSGLRPFGGFAKVLAQPPTAELRPPDRHQTDEQDLMPYDILDAIERLAIRDHLAPKDTLSSLAEQRPDIDAGKLRNWVIKFFRLWCRNQWKRERYAPSFHLDDESLDPKTWCRFPILSSGFEEELDALMRG